MVKLGATGTFPKGKLNKHDEGGLQLAVGTSDGNVIIDFGKPVHWLGMPKQEALAFAKMIIDKAESLP